MATERVCVVGLGYIGLPTACLLATRGFNVLGVDSSERVVDTINAGSVHIVEPDLDVLVRAAIQGKNLSANRVPSFSDVFIIAVPTPFKDGLAPDLSYVESAVKAIAPFIKEGNLVVLESTIPVGTTENMWKLISKIRPDLGKDSFFMAHCPERVLPGNILVELVKNDRIIGGINEASSGRAKSFYRKFVQGEIVVTNSKTAELSKLSENAFRDVNIAFANELSMICDRLDIDVYELIRLANRHPRVKILNPGVGVGGHCIAVDPWFIVDSTPEEARLIRTAREINDHKPHFFINKVMQKIGQLPASTRVAFFGLSYKPDTDDLRESPALEVVQLLTQKVKTKVFVVEPHIQTLPQSLASNSLIEKVDMQEALKSAEVLVLLVAHKEFIEIKNYPALKEKTVIDATGAWGISSSKSI